MVTVMLVGSLVFGLEVAFIPMIFFSAGSKLRVIETFGRLCLGGIEMPLLAFTTTGFGVATLGPEIWTPLF